MEKKNENMTVAEVIKKAQERKLFTKLQERERLRLMACVVEVRSQEQRELDRLKYDYLPMWSERARGSAAGTGLPSEAPMVDLMRPVASWGQDEGIPEPDPWICSTLDSAITEVCEAIPLARAALTVRYLNSGGPSVYRSGRLVPLTGAEIEDLCDAAERALVPVVKRKGLALW